MRLRLLAVALLLVGATPAASGSAAAADKWTTPHPGIRHLRRTVSSPKWEIHALVVDLARNDLRVQATRHVHKRRTTSSLAKLYGLAVAVNGDFFSYSNYNTVGLAMGDGVVWPGTKDTNSSGYIAFGQDNRAEIFDTPGVQQPLSWMRQIVGGKPLVVKAGKPVTKFDCRTHICVRHPRTVAGLTRDRNKLILYVVDGRTSRSLGMTGAELGKQLAGLGAWTAINLDGGGSSTLYVKQEGGVQNRPSGGGERSVANHLGVMIVNVPRSGSLVGFVREGDIKTGKGIPTARVELAGGRTVGVDSRGFYRFDGLAAGKYRATASAPGYVSGAKEREVGAAKTAWASIALRRAVGEPPRGESGDGEAVPVERPPREGGGEAGPADVPADGGVREGAGPIDPGSTDGAMSADAGALEPVGEADGAERVREGSAAAGDGEVPAGCGCGGGGRGFGPGWGLPGALLLLILFVGLVGTRGKRRSVR